MRFPWAKLVPAAPVLAALVLLGGGGAEAVVGQVGTTQLVSRATGLAPIPPSSVGSAENSRQSVSADGRYVVFQSDSDGLSPDDDNRFENIFVRDRQTNTTTLVSRASGLSGAASNAPSDNAVISADGTRVAWISTATNLDPAGVAGTHGQIYVRQWKDAPYTTQLVSISNGASPVEGNSNSYSPSISYDGSRIAFATQSTNLDTTATMSGYQIWVRDYSLPTPATILVSRANDGTPANAHCELPAISGDGHWVAFDTGATNMADGDTDAKSDVHLRGIDAGTTTLISKSTGGTIGNQASVQASVNKDGTKVAFLSWATNFDTVADTNSLADIYVRDLTGATTTLVSRADGLTGAVGDKESRAASISGDGLTIAFESTATNLAAGDTDLQDHEFVRRVDTGTTTLVDRADGDAGAIADYGSANPSISRDGSTVIFSGYSTNLTPEADFDLNFVFARDLAAKTTTLVSRPDGTDPFMTSATQYSWVYPGGLSADGRFVIFGSDSNDLVPGIDNRWPHLFVRDTLTNTTTLVDVGMGGAPSNGYAYDGTINADGTKVAFLSSASNLVPGDTNGEQDVFVRDLSTNQTTRVSTKSDGSQLPDASYYVPGIDGSGTKVVFATPAAATADDTNPGFDVYVRDLSAGTLALVSRADGLAGAVGNGNSDAPSISADGRRVAFASSSTNFEPGVPSGSYQIYVRDLAAGTTTLASRAGGTGGAIGDGSSSGPTLSADGKRVAFQSASTNLSPDATSGTYEVFVRDLAAGTTVVASRKDGPSGAVASGDNLSTQLSGDGNEVVFASPAPDLAPGDTNANYDVFLRDLSAGTTTAVSRANGVGGALSDDFSFGGAISGNGHCIAFRSYGGNLVPEVSGHQDSAFVYMRTVAGECPNDPPATTLTSTPPGKTKSRSATFAFTSNDSTATFECSLDGGTFAACGSGQSYSGLADGAHVFQVRAIDPAGNRDATPESASWQVDATGPVLTLIVPRQHLRRVLPRSRLWCYLRASEGSTGRVRLLWKGKLIGRVSVRVGTARASIPIKLRLTKKQRRGLKRARSAKFVLVVTAADDLGNPTTLKRALVLRR